MKAVRGFFIAMSAALSASHAAAMHLNPNGIGHVLLYPYYTVNKGQDTLLTLVNDEDGAAVVRVRFNEGRNGRPALELDVFLGPNDVWTAAVSADASSGGARLTAADSSCTDPAIPAGGLEFSTRNFDGSGSFPEDGWPADLARTREGSIEMISTGWILADSAAGRALTRPSGAAPDCTLLRANLPKAADLYPPRNIFGSAAIINVAEGTFFGYSPDAIADFWHTDERPYTPSAGPLSPSLAAPAAAPASSSFSARLPGAIVVDYDTRIDALSAVLMATQIENEYVAAQNIGGATDWIVTFPTKAYYTDPVHIGTQAPHEPFDDAPVDGRPVVQVGIALFDRDQRRDPPQEDPNLITATPLTLPYQVNALAIGVDAAASDRSAVLGSALTTPIPALGGAGRMRLYQYPSSAAPEGTLHILKSGLVDIDPEDLFERSAAYVFGLPSIGFMGYNIINAQAQPNRLANYSGAFRHRGHGWICQHLSGGLPTPCRNY